MGNKRESGCCKGEDVTLRCLPQNLCNTGLQLHQPVITNRGYVPFSCLHNYGESLCLSAYQISAPVCLTPCLESFQGAASNVARSLAVVRSQPAAFPSCWPTRLLPLLLFTRCSLCPSRRHCRPSSCPDTALVILHEKVETLLGSWQDLGGIGVVNSKCQ